MPDSAPNLILQLNGKSITLETIEDKTSLDTVLRALELKLDRIAVELNGDIVRRAEWAETPVRTGDRLEIVHFVGGGSI